MNFFKKKQDVTVIVRFKAIGEEEKAFAAEAINIIALIKQWFPNHVTVQVDQRDHEGANFKGKSSFDILVDNALVLTNTWIFEGLFTTATESKQAFVKKCIEDAMNGKTPDTSEFKKEVKMGRQKCEKDALDEANATSVELKRLRLENEEIKRKEKAEKLKVIKENMAAKEAAAAIEAKEAKAKMGSKAKSKARPKARNTIATGDQVHQPAFVTGAKAKGTKAKDADTSKPEAGALKEDANLEKPTAVVQTAQPADAAAGPPPDSVVDSNAGADSPSDAAAGPPPDSVVDSNAGVDSKEKRGSSAEGDRLMSQCSTDASDPSGAQTNLADEKAVRAAVQEALDLEPMPKQSAEGMVRQISEGIGQTSDSMVRQISENIANTSNQDMLYGLSMLFGFTQCCKASSGHYDSAGMLPTQMIDDDLLRA